jgi:hypothetical protein
MLFLNLKIDLFRRFHSFSIIPKSWHLNAEMERKFDFLGKKNPA